MRPGQAPPNPPSIEEWKKSDAYFSDYLIPKDPALDHALQNSAANGLPMIAVSAVQGKFLKLLAQSVQAKKILEVGTLGGYSTIWWARGLPYDGKVVTLELNEKFAQVAQQNINQAGVSSKVEIKVGPAAEAMKSLNAAEPFDLVFIDADGTGVPAYFTEAKRLTRKGGVIIVDNVNRWAKVALQPADTENADVKAIRQLFEQVKDDKEVDGTALGMAGAKGFDGFLYAVKL